MAVSEDAIRFFLEQLEGLDGVSSRRMFGGAGIYKDGVMFALLADDTPYFKVDDTNRAAFEAYGLGPFRPYPDRATTMSYYPVPADVLEDRPRLVEWARRALEIAARGARARRPRKKRPRATGRSSP